ncbi:MAG: alpha-1,2-fucosyltransferase [Solirubrobacteraceae bacterium]
MIAVEARGRLGNLMFQWAFAEAAAEGLRTRFAMDPTGLAGLFTLNGYNAPLRRASRLLALRAKGGMMGFPAVEIDNDDDPAVALATLRDGVRYGGYFQSERYFAGAAERVRSALTLHARHRTAFAERYGDLQRSGYVCVHARRGDYKEWRGGVALPWSYARDAIGRLGDTGLPLVFISDEIAEVREEFGDLPGARFETNDVALDLQLLVNASHVVLSNSSFSWWGGWLGGAAGRRVLAPRDWVGFREGREWPRDVIPAGWEQVPVQDGAS